jgi:hypothetical protein
MENVVSTGISLEQTLDARAVERGGFVFPGDFN